MIGHLGTRLGVPSGGVTWTVNPSRRSWIEYVEAVTSPAPLDRLPPFHGAADEVAYTEYAFDEGTKDAYTYRQFANGDILIVKSPRTTKQTLVKKNTTAGSAWSEIDKAIQARKAEADITKGTMPREDRDAIIKASGGALATIVSSFVKTAPKHKRKKKGKKGKGKRDKEQEGDDDTGSFPFAPVAIGGGILLVLGILVASSGSSSKKEDK